MKKKKKKKRTSLEEYIKAARKGSRDAEIEQHGHPLPKHHVHTSQKIYNRRKFKEENFHSNSEDF